MLALSTKPWLSYNFQGKNHCSLDWTWIEHVEPSCAIVSLLCHCVIGSSEMVFRECGKKKPVRCGFSQLSSFQQTRVQIHSGIIYNHDTVVPCFSWNITIHMSYLLVLHSIPVDCIYTIKRWPWTLDPVDFGWTESLTAGTPMSYEQLEFASSFASEQCPEGDFVEVFWTMNNWRLNDYY